MQNAVAMRERMFTMRLSEDESKRLDALAEHYGLNGAGLIRMLLKREEEAVERNRREHEAAIANARNQHAIPGARAARREAERKKR
jgi:hypothetical protein